MGRADDTDPGIPCDLAAERAMLGAMILSPLVVNSLVDRFAATEFYRPAHQTIFTTILDLYAADIPVDPISVCDRLTQDGNLTRCGGAPYLHTIISEVPTTTNASFYASIVSRKATQRRAMELGQRITQTARDWPDYEEGLLERVESLASKLTTHNRLDEELISLDDAVDEAFDRLAGPVPPTIPTGLIDLDDTLTGGLRKGAVYIIAAKTGSGKSFAGAGIGLHVASSGLGVLICSLEMGREEITNRILANMSGVELTAINTHALNNFDWARLRKARDQFRETPLMIRDTPYLTSLGLRRLAERLARTKTGLGLIVLDYAQLVTPADPKTSREQQVAEISRSCKKLALHLPVPIILLSQINRTGAMRDTPDTSDLRESGSLEADSDCVIILRLPTEEHRAGEIDAHVVKNRHGPPGVVSMSWSPHYARIRPLLREVS